MKFAPWVLLIILAVLGFFVLNNKNNEIERLNQQLAIANQQIAKANQEIARANQEISKADKMVAAASLPEATIEVAFRAAMMGSGSVAVISNTSDEAISSKS